MTYIARFIGPFAAKWALAFAAFSCCLPAPALAQSCTTSGTSALSFGTISHQAATHAQTTLEYTCQGNASTTYYRLCLAVGEGQVPGVNPRWMTNNNPANPANMKFDVYSDAARSLLIGPPPTGGSYTSFNWTFAVPGGSVQPGSAVIYGRVPGGQDLPSANTYQAAANGSQLSWAWSNAGYPANCTSGAGSGSLNFLLTATADVPSACRITLATDMDFGSIGGLGAGVNQTSRITVRCPSGTAWNLGLGKGANAAGNTRRMQSGAGKYVTYELYRDSGRSQVWGDTVGTDTVPGVGVGEGSPPTVTPVYGRVPVQNAPGGTYSDTVIITLTY